MKRHDSGIIVDRASVPELVDIKITNYCPFACEFCYQDSTAKGKHASFEELQYIATTLSEMGIFEVACLDGETPLFGPNGLSRIKELKIGSVVYDNNGTSKKIINITNQVKNCITLIGNKGWKITCTEDHPFLVDGKVVLAKDLLNKKLDQVIYKNKESKNYKLNLANSIVKSARVKTGCGGYAGGRVENDICRISANSTWIKTQIDLTEELMWLYGLTVAGGDRRGLSLNINEEDLAKKALNLYETIINSYPGNIIKNEEANSLRVEFSQPAIFKAIFFKAMKIPYGANNKRISFLFKIENNELLRSALYGLFLGDGCFRKKKNGKYTDFIIGLKTSSKALAEEVTYLLYTRFGVYSSIYEGINKPRKFEGRDLPETPYWSVEIYGKQNIEKVFPNSFEDLEYKNINITGNKNHDYIIIKNILPANLRTVYDITLENNSDHIYQLQHGVLTHNCGGGEPTLHPNFIDIVKTFNRAHILTNFTTKNLAWLRNPKQWVPIIQNTGGFAFSASEADEIEELAALIRTIAIKEISQNYQITIQHVVGTHYSIDHVIETARECGYTVTLLGYKTVGRGSSFTPKINAKDAFEEIKDYLKKNRWLRLGIDTLLAQQWKKELEEYSPESLYTLEEGMFSMYIDAVEGLAGPSSYCDSKLMQPYAYEYGHYKNARQGKSILEIFDEYQNIRDKTLPVISE